MTRSAMPLSRFTVLDLARVRAVSTVGRRFADRRIGAIEVEAPRIAGGIAGMRARNAT